MTADLGPILAMADREALKIRRVQLELEFKKDFGGMKPSRRAMRANQFAHQVMQLVRQFIPDACMEDALLEIALNAYGMDVEIVEVSPVRDAEMAAQIEAAAASMMPGTLRK